MTDQAGSALVRLKYGFFEALYALEPNVARYESPATAAAMNGEDGSKSGMWFLDDTQGEVELNVIQTPLRFDETVHPTLVIQCIGTSTDDTQYEVDKRAVNLLGVALAILARSPDLVEPDADTATISVIPESWTYTTGIDSQNMRAARFEVLIRLTSLIYLS